MSDFHDYLANDPIAWAWLSQQRGTGWHFCFARLNNSPSMEVNAYLLGNAGSIFTNPAFEDETRNRPSTEEFCEQSLVTNQQQTQNPINDIVDAGSASNSSLLGLADGAGTVAILCDQKGRLYVAGEDAFGYLNTWKLFGLGPEAIDGRVVSTVGKLGFRTKTNRKRLTRVLGENGDLEAVKFVGVTAHKYCLAALDDSGSIWFSGDPCRASFAEASQFPNDSNGLLSWFRKADFESFEDASGTVTPAESLSFKKIRAGDGTMIGLDKDGHLYVWGTFNLGKQLTSTRPHRVDSFVDSVSLDQQGDNYTSFPTVTVSAPQHPNGTTAEVAIGSIVNKKIQSIQLIHGGWGYTSAPTITFSGGGGSGATATASLFSGTWIDCAAGYNKDRPPTCAAVSNAGKLYVTGDRWLYDGRSWSSQSSGVSFASVSLGLDHGVLLTTNGSVGIWGFGLYLGREVYDSLSSIQTASFGSRTVIGAAAFGRGYALLMKDGRIYTAGLGRQAGRGVTTDFVPLNDQSTDGVSKARFSAIFGTQWATFLNRIESRDEFGNLIDPLPPGLPS